MTSIGELPRASDSGDREAGAAWAAPLPEAVEQALAAYSEDDSDTAWRALRSAIATALSREPTTPSAGYRVVPEEPTSAMIQAARYAANLLDGQLAAVWAAMIDAAPPAPGTGVGSGRTFPLRARVRKTRGSSWQGRVVGHYSTALTSDGVCIESEREPGSVQIYPAAALEAILDEAHSLFARPGETEAFDDEFGPAQTADPLPDEGLAALSATLKTWTDDAQAKADAYQEEGRLDLREWWYAKHVAFLEAASEARRLLPAPSPQDQGQSGAGRRALPEQPIFIIGRTVGEYSDRREDVIATTFDGEAAKRWTEETQRICQALAVETNQAWLEAEWEEGEAIKAAAKARCPDPTFEPWGSYAEDVQYWIYELPIGLPAPPAAPAPAGDDEPGARS